MTFPRRWSILIPVILLMAGCQAAPRPGVSQQEQVAKAVTQTIGAMFPTPQTAAATFTLAPMPRPSATRLVASPTPVLPSATPLPPTPTAPVFDEPAGCRKPQEEDGRRVQVNGWTINQRTQAMLRYAQELYGGKIQLAGSAITQGSYHDNGAASFGTHLGGGAVDLSVFLPGTWTVDFAHLDRLVRSLRVAGFAAWVRVPDEVFPGSGWHIHAIAIGDAELSKEAQDQLNGTDGYFLGYNGLPQANGVPVADRDGPPLLCQWMAELGYRLPETNSPPGTWQTRLQNASDGLVTSTQEGTIALAQKLGLSGSLDSLPLLEGPLSASLWQAGGLAPAYPNPLAQLRTYLPSDKRAETLAGLLSEEDYEILHFDVPPQQFDFQATPLRTGDLVELRATSGKSHLITITGKSEDGRMFTTVPLKVESGAWNVVQVSLTGANGLLENDWAQDNLTSFTVFRPRWALRPPFDYIVHPGDTHSALQARFGGQIEGDIEVGKTVTIK